MKKTVFILACLFIFSCAFAQTNGRHKIVVFAPLYLDSAFTNSGGYAFNKTFPKFLNAGIEFFQGAQLALDSLQKKGAPLEVFIYDIKDKNISLANQVRNLEMANIELVIAQSNVPETRMLADACRNLKIPFISATLPNDAGITNNQFVVMLNTTLQGHIENIYAMLQKNFSREKLVVFRKGGQQEDAIKSHFMEFGKTTTAAPLNIKYVDLPQDATPQLLARHLDSNRRNIIIAGSMDEAFGTRLAQGLTALKSYPSTLIGMPTWDNFSFSKPEFKSVDIIYTTPFFYNRNTPLETKIGSDFEKQIGSRPTDMFYRGYETTLRFALLLLDTKKDIASNLTRKGNIVFTRFDVQPVFKDKQGMTLDYFENKHVYFVRVSGGVKRLMY